MLLELTSIGKSYPAPGGAAIEVLSGVDLQLEAGQSLAIIGPSGSGKSTLLNIIAGLDTPTAGSVKLGGQDLSAMNERALAAMRRDRIGFVFQQHHLLPQCSVLENVLVPTLAGRRDPSARERAKELLKRVGLADRLKHRPGQLSMGQCQRVAVARALINRPSLLLADEPTGSLDHDSRDVVADLLAGLSAEGLAMLVVTHSVELAARMASVRRLDSGRLVEPQTAEDRT